MGTDVFERLWRAAKEQETKKALLREKLWREELEKNNHFQPRIFRRSTKGTTNNKRRSASGLAPAPAAAAATAAPRDVVREAGEGRGEGEIGSVEAAASASAGSGSASVLSAVGHMCCSGPASMGQGITMSLGSEPEGAEGSSRVMVVREAGEGRGEGEIGSVEAAASASAGSGSASVLSAVGHMCCSGPASMGQGITMSLGSEPEGAEGSSRVMVVREAGEGRGEGEIGSVEAAASASAGSGSASVLSAVGHMCCSGPASMGQGITMSLGSEPEGAEGSSRVMNALRVFLTIDHGLAERDIPSEVYMQWQNSRGHLSFRIAILASPRVFTLASSLAKRAPLEEVDHGAMNSNGAWLSIDPMTSLPSLASNKKLYAQVHGVFSKLVYQYPEFLLRALAVVPSATAGRLRVEILSELLSLDFRPICGMRAEALIRRLLQVDPGVVQSGVEAFNADGTMPNVVYNLDGGPSSNSCVFKPHDPWIMRISFTLHEMYIKFEIEMLGQSFKVALADVPIYSCLRTRMVPQKENNDNFNIMKVTIQDAMQQANG